MTPGPAASRHIVAMLLVVGGLLLAGCGGASTAPEPTLAGMVRTPALSVAAVELPDVGAGGTPVAMRADEDQLLLVYFGYTFCPDICPTTMSDISVAIHELPDQLAERVRVGMVTVDPERDTPEVLVNYLDHFFTRGLALRTDDPAVLDAAADAFGVRYEVEEHAEGEPIYAVSHSAVTYVVDDTGSVVVEWPFGMDSLDMADDIQTLLTGATA